MNNSVCASDRLLANVIRSAGLASGEPARPAPEITDWPALVKSAASHSVTGLLYSALTRSGGMSAAPQEMRDALRRAYVKTLALNARKLNAFAEIASDLAARDVPVIALKGCALATTLYDDAGQRFVGDLDFLARHQDLAAIADVVTRRGFQQHLYVFTESTRDAQMGEMSYVRSDTPPISLDVHWHIFNIPYYVEHVPLGWFWANTTPATINGQAVLVLNDEAMLLHLCSHYVLHHVAMPHLRWSHDIALLLARRGDAIDWQRMVDAARRFGLLGVLQQVLSYVLDLWDVQLAPVQHALVFGASPTLGERVISRALVVQPLRPIVDGLMTGGVSRRLHYWRDVFFPNVAYMRRRYGREVSGPLFFFYVRRLRNGFRRLIGVQR
jgi:hypothetical protein